MIALSNLPGRAPLNIQQGADFIQPLSLTAAGVAVDLTGATLAAQIRKNPADATPAASFTIAIHSPATSGTAVMSLPASVTQGLLCGPTLIDPLSRYHWDLKLTDSNGLVTVLLSGEVRVNRDITR